MTLQNRVTPFDELVADPLYRGKFMGNRGRAPRCAQANRPAPRWQALDHLRLGLQGRAARTDDPRSLHRTVLLRRRCCPRCWSPTVCVVPARGLHGVPRGDRGARRRIDVRGRPRRPSSISNDVTALHNAAISCPVPMCPTAQWLPSATLPTSSSRGEMFEWSSTGYRPAGSVPTGDVEMLTPPLTATALRGGFRPEIHPSLRESGYS